MQRVGNQKKVVDPITEQSRISEKMLVVDLSAYCARPTGIVDVNASNEMMCKVSSEMSTRMSTEEGEALGGKTAVTVGAKNSSQASLFQTNFVGLGN